MGSTSTAVTPLSQPGLPGWLGVGANRQIRYAGCMRELSDEQLMKRYAKNDQQAFTELYQRHRGPLYRYMMRSVGQEVVANDLYQGVWEKVIRARKQYRPKAKFTTWLYRIAHNHLVDHYRRQKPLTETGSLNLANPGPEPDRETEGAQRSDKLFKAIAKLPREQRSVLLLKLEQGLSLEEIAQVTGIKRETAKSRLRYAVAKLQKRLQI